MEKKEKELSFEDALAKLEEIVKNLESGDTKLDDAIKEYTEAMNLSKICSDKLNSAEESINKLVREDGTEEEFKPLEDEE